MRRPGQRLGESGGQRTGGGTDPQGGHRQRRPALSGSAENGGYQ
jgi:hypothetical protein